MASKSIFLCLALLVVLCLIMMNQASGCNGSTRHGCLNADATVALETKNRKVLGGLKEKKEELHKSASSGNGGNNYLMGWDYQLRKVPSGPDPLHHNGNSPKKPRTP
ncbi:protein CLAVATA 3 [Ziziphus jujuba]|uniref:Protein CLAVATA 3 n=1 Tax=Ziziphus jujuba TaxID=326968 RepID=A0A6P3ZEB5_ZIZJJ|nr:protein CLAVATA 3 [Ziziphus jujuba]